MATGVERGAEMARGGVEEKGEEKAAGEKEGGWEGAWGGGWEGGAEMVGEGAETGKGGVREEAEGGAMAEKVGAGGEKEDRAGARAVKAWEDRETVEKAVKAVKAWEDREKEEMAEGEVQAVVALVKVARAPEGSLAAPGVAWAGGRRRSQLRWGRHHANIRRKPMTEPGKYHTGTRAGTPDRYPVLCLFFQAGRRQTTSTT